MSAQKINNLKTTNLDAYTPAQIATRVKNAGVGKANLPALQTFVLAILGGAFIAFGAMFYTLVVTNTGMGLGPERLLGGIVFSLGLILVVIAGAELFTGNNLIVMAWVEKRISLYQLLINWGLVFVGNLVGAIATALIVHFSGVLNLGDGAVTITAQNIAVAKTQIPFTEAFFRGLLCNTLVCLAIWLCFAAHSVAGKILAIIFPVSAFVALGFEHSVANMYFIPVGYMAGATEITINGFLANLVPVVLGNIMGGSFLVASVYWMIYLWKKPE
ncbi:MAG: formate/nitrite transporter family protein [Halopseudomonas aestusnigri]